MNNAELPRECSEEGWAKLRSWGVLKGEIVDDLWVSVLLPQGWRKDDTSGYWSSLVDQEGHVRAAIFYKGDFYDRAAHMDVRLHRYSIEPHYFGCDPESLGYNIKDNVLDNIHVSFPSAYWGYLEGSASLVVGLIHPDGNFYYAPSGTGKDAHFTKSRNAKFATKISRKSFYDNFHNAPDNQIQCRGELDAVENLLKPEVAALVEELNLASDW